MTLNKRKAKLAIKLLGRLREHLASAIASELALGEIQPCEKWLRAQVARD